MEIILFIEPREYGVAHFKFDADETKRMEQMQELNVSRQKVYIGIHIFDDDDL